MGGGLELFDGGSGSSSSSDSDVPEIKINKEFARRYEHNKKREDLQRYEELKKRGLANGDSADSESSEEEDEEEDEDDVALANSKKKDLEFLEALIKVKKRDPILKNKDVELFKSDETENTTRNKANKVDKKKKKMYLKDVNAKHLMEDGPELGDNDNATSTATNVYDEEQEQIRREFLNAVGGSSNDDDDDDDGDLLVEKDKNTLQDDDDDEDSVDNAEYEQKLNQCFPDDDEDAKFLRTFIKDQLWKEDKRSQGPVVKEEDLEMVSEDEMEIERQEEYEHRFQENAGDRILGHSRQVEGSVRKKVKARTEQRKSKEDRMEIARLEREEELRHLKNLKKKENEEKLQKIMQIAGIKEGDVSSSFDPKELEREFDPQEYDRMMKAAFDEEYYEAEDAEFKVSCDMDEDDGEIEKPDFNKEDELLGLPKGWESVGAGDGFLAAREKALKLKKESIGDHDEEDEEEYDEQQEEEDEEDSDEEEDEDKKEEDEEKTEKEEPNEEGKQEKKRKLALLERAKKEMMDEYYKLDYEDTIGDLKTRFKYAKIKPNRYGLTTAEILAIDEKELNQYVSLKKLAPYTETEWKVPNNKRNEIKQKVKEIFRQGKSGNKKNRKRPRISEDAKDSNLPTGAMGQSSKGAQEHGKDKVGDSNGDMSKKSRSARRRHLQAERKLPASRLMAYGVVPEKSKKKGKH